MKLGLVPSLGGREVLRPEQCPMPSAGSAAEIEEAYAGAARRGLELAGVEGLRVAGVGVSTPGPFDYEAGVSLMDHKYAAIRGMSVRGFVRKVVGPLPVRFIHDSFAFLLGELAIGVGAEFERPCLATIGTGLGFAGMIDGRLLRSPSGGPALSVYKSAFREGIAEDYVSARAILARYGARGGRGGPSVKDVAGRAAAGDPICAGAFADAGEALAEILAPIIAEQGFDCLILGGQIAKAGELLAGPARRRLAALGRPCAVETASRIDEAPLLGAARLFSEGEVTL